MACHRAVIELSELISSCITAVGELSRGFQEAVNELLGELSGKAVIELSGRAVIELSGRAVVELPVICH